MTLFKNNIKILLFIVLSIIISYMHRFKDGYILNLSIKELNLKIFLLYTNIYNREENIFYQCSELIEVFQNINIENTLLSDYLSITIGKLNLKKYYRMKYFYRKLCMACKIFHHMEYDKSHIISVNDSNINRIFHIIDRRVVRECLYYKFYRMIDNYILLNRPYFLNIYINDDIYMFKKVEIDKSNYLLNFALAFNKNHKLVLIDDKINFLKRYKVLMLQYKLN